MSRRATPTVSWSAAFQGYELSEGKPEAPPRELHEGPAWVAWLEQVSSFAFQGQAGSFTARKERKQRGTSYWSAYRKTQGTLVKKYLGTSRDLTLARLEAIAAQLATAAARPAQSPALAAEGGRRTHGKSAPELGSRPPLPRPLSPLLGRSSERAQLVALLRRPEVCLLTLTGPGGVGKTRLALEAAQDLLPDFADGVCFVPLSAISELDFVLPAIAQALGLRQTDARSPLGVLQTALADQALLLLLDNFEQVLPAAPLLAELLSACPHLKLLVTSRAALRLQGEQELAVSPLALPDLAQLPTPQSLLQYGACALFVERVQAIQPDFAVTQANTPAIAEICLRLDGLPLAIELAAARSRLLSPQALLARLEHRLDVLTGGTRDAPDRQQTMRATIAWSYQLLAPEEQQLFRFLSVFAGGCTLQAVEAIIQPTGLAASTVLDGVSALLENHLLRQVEQPNGEPHLLMLETIREYGLECLERGGELEATRTAHAAYYLALAEEAAPRLRGTEQASFMAQLEREQENLRAALGFLLEQAHTQTGTQEGDRQVEWAMRLCVALSRFWSVHGDGQEGLSYLMSALAEGADVTATLRARALGVAAELAFLHARHLPLERLAEESLALYQELDDPVGTATGLYLLGYIARLRSQFAQAQAYLQEAAVRFQALGDRWRQGQCFTEWARVAIEQGQYGQAQALLADSLLLYQELGDQQRFGFVRILQAHLLFVQQQDEALARQLAEQSLAYFRQLGDTPYRAFPLVLLGLMQLKQGELEAARPLLEESLALTRQAWSVTDGASGPALALARLLARQGEVAEARHLYRESLSLLVEFNVFKEGIAASLEGLATLEVGEGKPLQAVWLWGAAHALREAIGAPLYPVSRASYEHALAKARAQLGEPTWRQAWTEGRKMTPVQALAALEQAMTPTAVPVGAEVAARLPTRPSPFGLTARELDVLRWLAQGLSDAQIAEQLVIARRTVNWYLTSIYSKLGVSSRAAATRAALEQHLV